MHKGDMGMSKKYEIFLQVEGDMSMVEIGKMIKEELKLRGMKVEVLGIKKKVVWKE